MMKKQSTAMYSRIIQLSNTVTHYPVSSSSFIHNIHSIRFFGTTHTGTDRARGNDRSSSTTAESVLNKVNESIDQASNTAKNITSNILNMVSHIGDRAQGSTVQSPSSQETKNATIKAEEQSGNQSEEMLKRTDRQAKNPPQAQRYESNQPDGHPAAEETTRRGEQGSPNTQN